MGNRKPRRVEDDDDAVDSDVYREARRLVRMVRGIQRTLYQLAYIYTSNAPQANEAYRLMEQMVKEGLITRAQMEKAINDAMRFRELQDRRLGYYEYYPRRGARSEDIQSE